MMKHLALLAFRLLAFGSLGFGAMALAAGHPFDVAKVTPGEFAQLPEYCPDTQAYSGRSNDPNPQQRQWLAVMGETFWHVHHYCWGILKANRANVPGIDAAMRNSLLSNAIEEANYVASRAPDGFLLLPEILLRMGMYSAALQRPVDALEFFERSRKAKPDYWPAYVEAAKVNVTIGRREHAIALLRLGLEAIPGDRRLTEELARLNSRAPQAAQKPR